MYIIYLLVIVNKSYEYIEKFTEKYDCVMKFYVKLYTKNNEWKNKIKNVIII